MSKQHESTPLLHREYCQTTSLTEMTWVERVEQPKGLPSKTVYLHSVLMGLASFANVVGSCFAINAGAHMVAQDDPTQPKVLNPFFFTAMATSLIYFGANAIEVNRIRKDRAKTHVQIEDQRRAATELRSVVIEQ